MKNIFTVLLSFSMAIAISQSLVTTDTPTSYYEINGEDFIENKTAYSSDAIITSSGGSRVPLLLAYYTDRGVFDTDNPGLPIET